MKGNLVFGTALSEVAVIFLGFSASMEVGDGFHLMEVLDDRSCNFLDEDELSCDDERNPLK